MHEVLNRAAQLHILRALAAHYPDKVDYGDIPLPEQQNILAHLFYLKENALVDFEQFHALGERSPTVYNVSITARGLDFLQDDGGLSAILGVVTVKLHDDTIKQLLLDKIESAEEDEPGAKAKLLAQVRALPANATHEVAMTAIRAGIAQMPAAVPLIRAMLGL